VVVVEEVKRQTGVAMPAGGIAAGVSPLAGKGLDEAFGLAVGLGPVGPGEAVLDAEIAAGVGEGVGAVADAVVGENGVDFDAMEGVEADHLVQGADDAGDFFIGMDAGEAQAGVVVDGHMQSLDAGTFVAIGAVAGAAHARAGKAAEFLDVEMDEFAGRISFIADDRWRCRVEGFEQIQAMAFEDAPDGGLGDRDQHHDLGVRTALATPAQNVSFQSRRGASWLALGHAGTFEDALRDPFLADAGEPAADGFFTDTAGGCCPPQCQSLSLQIPDHLGSTSGGELGISVHVVRAVEL